MLRRFFLTGLILGACLNLNAQVTGGRFSMPFLLLPSGPHVSALGGYNVSNPDQDISMALQNPSLMRPGLHNQLGVNYNGYYAGIKIVNVSYGYHSEKLNTSFLLGVQNVDYGDFKFTDPYGAIFSDFTANDLLLTAGASRSFGERWRAGASLKLANSVLLDATAFAVAADVGVNYYDTANLISVGIVAKNMGGMIKRYNGSSEPLPFDLQIGVSKRFQHLPLRIMATAHHLYEWNVRYDNPDDVAASTLTGTQDSNASTKSYFGDKLFRHLLFAGEFYLGKAVGITVSYNHLRRGELALEDRKATSGFAFGLNLYLKKVQVHYARSYYHIAGAYNELGFNFALGQLFSLGRFGKSVNWSAQHPDWPSL